VVNPNHLQTTTHRINKPELAIIKE